MKIRTTLILWTFVMATGVAQTTHPALVQMLEKCRTVEYGNYRLVIREHYPYSSDTIVYRANCAFSRFEQLNGKPGIRFEVEAQIKYPNQTVDQHVVFDGQIKYDFRGDSLVMLYDTRQLDDEYTYRGLQYFFFIPLMLHPGQVQKFLGPDKYLGTPPYFTLGDTLIGSTPCTWVGADWVLDTAGVNQQHLRFGISKTTGLPVYFSQVEVTKNKTTKPVPHRKTLEIWVEDWSGEIPMNSFYVDWPSLPQQMEVKLFIDCYHKETLRPRNQPGL